LRTCWCADPLTRAPWPVLTEATIIGIVSACTSCGAHDGVPQYAQLTADKQTVKIADFGLAKDVSGARGRRVLLIIMIRTKAVPETPLRDDKKHPELRVPGGEGGACVDAPELRRGMGVS
jgi:hypothetical protein